MKLRPHWIYLVSLTTFSVVGCANRNTYGPYPNYPQYQAYPYGYGQPGQPGQAIQPSPSVGGTVPMGYPNTGALNVPGSIPTYPVAPGTMQPAGMPGQPGQPGQPGIAPNIPAGYQYGAPPTYPMQQGFAPNPTSAQPWFGS